LPFAGGILDAQGGMVGSEGIRVLAGAGDVLGQQAAELRRLSVTNFASLVGTNFNVRAVFELGMAGVVSGRKLVAQMGGLPTNGFFVLARVLYDHGLYGLQPRERLRSDVVGRLSSVEPVGTVALDGLTGAGQFALVQLSAAQGLVRGSATNSAGG